MNGDGIIYGYVGVIGSGKSYNMEKLSARCRVEGRPLVIGDFSEGIRRFLMELFTGESFSINVNSEVYQKWKANPQELLIPRSEGGYGEMDKVFPNGRGMLQRAGEMMKRFAGQDVWAKWTRDYVIDFLVYRDSELLKATSIGFGSVRFLCEASAVLAVGKTFDKEVKFIFCNYLSDRYELNDHPSEALARRFVEMGYKDGMDITSEIVRMTGDGRIY